MGKITSRQRATSASAAPLAIGTLAPLHTKEELDQMSEEQKLSELLALIDKMNMEIMRSEPAKMFLWRLNYAVMRTSQPIPRSICLKVRGVDKKLLRKLTEKGFLKEYRMRSSVNNAIYVAYTLPDDVTFEGGKIVRLLPLAEQVDKLKEDTFNALGE